MIHADADVATDADVSPSASVWALAQVRSGASLGAEVIVGRGAYIGPGVRVGDRSKIQNYALVYEPAVIEPGVFIGPAAVLTNDRFPRAVNPDGSQKRPEDWSAVGVVVREGASIGASATAIGPIVIGYWSMIAAGAIVTRDVPDFALVAGAPARRVAWVSRAGHRLSEVGSGTWSCPVTGESYREHTGQDGQARLELVQ